MMNHVTQNWTLVMAQKWTWRPSRKAVQTAMSCLGSGAAILLCTFPALAAASLRGKETLGESGIQGLEFLAFIAIVALAPVMILFTASVARMLLGKLGWMANPVFEPAYQTEPTPVYRDLSAPRATHVPNAQFGVGKVEVPRSELNGDLLP